MARSESLPKLRPAQLYIEPPAELVQEYYDSLSRYWLPIARPADLEPKRPKLVQLLGRDVVLARLDGQVVVMENVCRHFQARLSDGSIESGCKHYAGDVLRCGYHGWAYSKEGDCVEIPQLKDGQKIPAQAKIQSFAVAEKHDLIWTCINPPSTFEIPDFPEASAPDMVPTKVEWSEPWSGSLVRMVLSALDDYHFPWLHEGVLGSRERPESPERKVSRNGRSLVSEFQTKQPANVTNALENRADLASVDYVMQVDMPNVIRLIKRNAEGGTYVVCFFPMPISFNKTGIFWRVIRNYDFAQDKEEEILKMEAFIQSQDKVHVSFQRPWLMKALPIKGVDGALWEYLTWLDELGIPNQI